MYLGFFVFFIQRCQDTSQRGPQFKCLWNTWVICEFTKFCFVVLFYLRQVFTLSPGWPGIHYMRFSQNPDLLLYLCSKGLGAEEITLPSLVPKHNLVIIQVLIKWRQETKRDKVEVNTADILYAGGRVPKDCWQLEKPKTGEQKLPSGTPGTLTFASKVISASWTLTAANTCATGSFQDVSTAWERRVHSRIKN